MMSRLVRAVLAATLSALALTRASAQQPTPQQPPPAPPTPLQLAIRPIAALNLEGRTADARRALKRLIDSLPTPLEKSQAQRALAMTYAFDADCTNTVKYEQMVIDYWKTREAAEPQNAFFQQGELANEAARACIDAGSLDVAEQLYRQGYAAANREPAPRT